VDLAKLLSTFYQRMNLSLILPETIFLSDLVPQEYSILLAFIELFLLCLICSCKSTLKASSSVSSAKHSSLIQAAEFVSKL